MRQALPMRQVAYLAPDGFLQELLAELGSRAIEVHGRLVLAAPDSPAPAWVANVWYEPQRLTIESIGGAATKLREIQRNWALYSCAHHRRASLIADRLPRVSARPLVFGEAAPTAPLGSWTLLAPGTLLAAARCSSPFPNGEARFVENHDAPPSRAYLKLWEALTLIGDRPRPGQRCLDLGAAPGGWTWVLAGLGAEVVSVDKAPLDPRIETMPGVRARRQSAFALDPEAEPPFDWLFSDVVCYPERLFGLIERWRAAGRAHRFVCTLKFQGETDFATARRFADVPGSRLVHLHHNKHELTWISLPGGPP